MENDVFVTIAFIFHHKPRQTAYVGFILFYWARLRAFLSRNIGRNTERNLFSLFFVWVGKKQILVLTKIFVDRTVDTVKIVFDKIIDIGYNNNSKMDLIHHGWSESPCPPIGENFSPYKIKKYNIGSCYDKEIYFNNWNFTMFNNHFFFRGTS